MWDKCAAFLVGDGVSHKYYTCTAKRNSPIAHSGKLDAVLFLCSAKLRFLRFQLLSTIVARGFSRFTVGSKFPTLLATNAF